MEMWEGKGKKVATEVHIQPVPVSSHLDRFLVLLPFPSQAVRTSPFSPREISIFIPQLQAEGRATHEFPLSLARFHWSTRWSLTKRLSPSWPSHL